MFPNHSVFQGHLYHKGVWVSADFTLRVRFHSDLAIKVHYLHFDDGNNDYTKETSFPSI